LPYLDIGHTRISYTLVKRAGRRYTYFRFRPDMTLEVVLPKGREIDVAEALRAKLRWIAMEYERLAAARRVLGSDEVLYGGSYLKIVVTEGEKDELIPDMAAGEVTVRTNDRRRVRELVRRWFLTETSAYVVRKVSEFAPLVGVRPARVDVREITKWGYCTRSGRLSFSWQLIALPDRLREYVVLHELTHLMEFNHSPSFKRKLSSICSDYRQRERELAKIIPYDRMSLM
jgi:hypothetical protein